NPGMLRSRVLLPSRVWAPGSALGSPPRVALSSAWVPPVYLGGLGPSKSPPGDLSEVARESRILSQHPSCPRVGRGLFPSGGRPRRTHRRDPVMLGIVIGGTSEARVPDPHRPVVCPEKVDVLSRSQPRRGKRRSPVAGMAGRREIE